MYNDNTTTNITINYNNYNATAHYCLLWLYLVGLQNYHSAHSEPVLNCII